jgi:hypothetical protein
MLTAGKIEIYRGQHYARELQVGLACCTVISPIKFSALLRHFI